jgi:hypothetical protein
MILTASAGTRGVSLRGNSGNCSGRGGHWRFCLSDSKDAGKNGEGSVIMFLTDNTGDGLGDVIGVLPKLVFELDDESVVASSVCILMSTWVG